MIRCEKPLDLKGFNTESFFFQRVCVLLRKYQFCFGFFFPGLIKFHMGKQINLLKNLIAIMNIGSNV